MKEKCDNHCETCSMAGQVYCSLVYTRATNQSLPGILERLESLEMEMQDLRKWTLHTYADNETDRP